MTKPKIAVLIVGMYREFEDAVQSWDFLKDDTIDYDIYFSTWDRTYQRLDALGIDKDEPVTLERICKVVTPVSTSIESETQGKFGSQVFNLDIQMKMFHRWTRGVSLIKFSGIKYDNCILIRPDLFIGHHRLDDLYRELPNDTMYTLCGITKGHEIKYGNDNQVKWICDWLLIMNQQTLYKMNDLIIDSENIRLDGYHRISDIHQHLHDLFTTNTINIQPIISDSKIFIGGSLLRPNTKIPSNEQSVHDASTKWFHAFLAQEALRATMTPEMILEIQRGSLTNLSDLVQDSSYPVLGFLRGDNILSKSTYQKILNYDYTNICQAKTIGNRRAMAFKPGEISAIDEASLTLQQLAEHLSRFEVLEGLINHSFQGLNFGIDDIWHGGLEAIKERFKGGILLLNEDVDGYMLTPHSDNRTIIANLQIFLEPDVSDVGTRFHFTGNFGHSKKIPFVGNSGYFLVNSDVGFHSAENRDGVVRRSIIFSWLI